ncbi:FAD-dependent oxidoreductase [Thalassotalea sp. G2M2-11]|uniref:FAD-dependent oxidoreductase n=1 Tax=Thalassotalea sp. G2M2-11 TaxID=2787627 RepID=UPI0019CFE964|nr:FAD-dependent oxidoreductase [Thalassotalea sp. G2M2-11]
MKQVPNYDCDTVIAGGGIAGLVCALELLKQQQQVIIVDRDTPERLGGLARWAFGGMALCQTNEQQRMKIADNSQRLYQDWLSFAQFSANDYWPKAWAKEYAEHNYQKVYLWLKQLGIKFLPAVNWVERGLYTPGNSLPRYHVIWGTGWHLIETIIEQLTPFIDNGQLNILYQHKAIEPVLSQEAHSLKVLNEVNDAVIDIIATNIVIACGGINGSLKNAKSNWLSQFNNPNAAMLNGANPISDGQLHQQLASQGVKLTHIEKMWNYAAGIPHPQAEFDDHGLSLIPCKSALWLDHQGKRIGPEPLVTGFDTHFLCQKVAKLEKPWTWQILNWNIAKKELAVSGSAHNPSIRDRKLLQFLQELVFGNQRLVNQLIDESDQVLCADSVEALAAKMNQLTDKDYVDSAQLSQAIQQYDQQFTKELALENDDQLRRIHHARQWRPDKLRTCKPAAILANPQSNKLIAIRLQLIARKSLGGIQTNLDSQVLDQQGNVIPRLYCIGEAAGFGGGGSNGEKSLEGTFLSGCILTARNAADAMIKKENNK